LDAWNRTDVDTLYELLSLAAELPPGPLIGDIRFSIKKLTGKEPPAPAVKPTTVPAPYQ
jgi:hypothetical protein